MHKAVAALATATAILGGLLLVGIVVLSNPLPPIYPTPFSQKVLSIELEVCDC